MSAYASSKSDGVDAPVLVIRLRTTPARLYPTPGLNILLRHCVAASANADCVGLGACEAHGCLRPVIAVFGVESVGTKEYSDCGALSLHRPEPACAVGGVYDNAGAYVVVVFDVFGEMYESRLWNPEGRVPYASVLCTACRGVPAKTVRRLLPSSRAPVSAADGRNRRRCTHLWP